MPELDAPASSTHGNLHSSHGSSAHSYSRHNAPVTLTSSNIRSYDRTLVSTTENDDIIDSSEYEDVRIEMLSRGGHHLVSFQFPSSLSFNFFACRRLF
jgi:hypothetical protein